MTFFAGQHLRQHSPRGINMRHHVYVPASLPVGIRSFRPTLHADSGVGTEDVNLSELLGCLLHQALHVGFFADIGSNRRAFNFPGYTLRALLINVRDDNGPRALGSKCAAECLSNSIGPAGHNHDFVLYLHDGNDKWFCSVAATNTLLPLKTLKGKDSPLITLMN